MEEKLLSWFGESWRLALGDYLMSPEFFSIAKQVTKAREQNIVYPDSTKVFRAFKETPYDKVSVVLLGQDVFHDGSASGLAFDNSESLRMSPSLRIINQELIIEYPELADRFLIHGSLDEGDLTGLCKQGVFLYNCALTVNKKQPGSHMEIWKPFTEKVIETLSKRDFLVWILLGKFAQAFEPKINPKHAICKAAHPASAIYNVDSGFLNSGIFRQCNYHLNRMGKLEISW